MGQIDDHLLCQRQVLRKEYRGLVERIIMNVGKHKLQV